jgi:glycosyltransferase involved in cell wall biosynthesis
LRILTFSFDTNLLLPADSLNESQYRQTRYCEVLGQERSFVIIDAACPYQERFLAEGRIWARGASATFGWHKSLLAYFVGSQIYEKFSPDIIEYQDPRIAGIAAYLLARQKGSPLVGGVFNDTLGKPLHGFHRPMYHIGNWFGEFVLSRTILARCDSLETTRALRDMGYKQVRYIPFFVPWLERLDVSVDVHGLRLARWQSDPVILCVSRLSEEKNIPLLLRAFHKAFTVTGRGRLIIVGVGMLERQLKCLTTELRIQDRIHWAGYVSQSDLIHLYCDANIFVMPSDSETSARVLIQAQASRLPTITTATSGSREIVKDGETGYVTQVGDDGQFAEALVRLTSDDNTYRRMLFSHYWYDWKQHGEQEVISSLRTFYDDARSPLLNGGLQII